MSYNSPVKYAELNTYGGDPDDDVYDVKTFIEYCESGAFIDYDGYGYPVRNDLADRSTIIVPSRCESIPSDATHVLWLNR